MTRWLDDEEQEAWRAFYGTVTLLIDRLDRELQHDAGMPHAYYEILVVLSEAPQRSLRMSELALLTRSSRSRLSHAVTKLEAHGWVKRRDCDDDKRGQFADLTDQGFAALVAAAPGHVETVRRHLFDALAPEQIEQLQQISQAIAETLKT
ncbi:MarR family winged helix-turn-helix transcriptional regulator [Dactylosporangium sp. CA-092794]|uniref:MarR family winged helix-turn-helix transcriptional regulator n=1 Tax=Dactylosporangium sp. CA-092794 TaxID=3239929 RepID=UPI003D8EF274